MMPLDHTTEIRFLPRSNIAELGNMLEIGQSWKKVMELIPGKPWQSGDLIPEGETYSRKYTSDEIFLVEGETHREKRTGFEILVEEWGTSGIKRARILDLINLLQKAELIRAADYMLELVGEYSDQTGTEVMIGLELQSARDNSLVNAEHVYSRDDILKGIVSNNVEQIAYEKLSLATKSFEEVPLESGGHMIGRGAFAVVYKGKLSPESGSVAIKRFHNLEARTDVQFKTEIEILAKCCHKNVLKLEGFSLDGPHLCLLYTYMSNGSLHDRLACLDSASLSWVNRLKIAEETAEGITYLHTNFSPPIVHRDIKSANILLDQDYTPKVGDFGIVRFGGIGTQTQFTTTAFGTSHYMAPEAFGGDVSVKMDTFSYAIVLLEILTGLPPYDEQREDRDLLTYVGAHEDDLIELLDPKAGYIDQNVAESLFALTDLCTEKKKSRPTMEITLIKLKQIIS